MGPDYKKSSREVIISAVSPMVAVDAGVLTGGCVVPVPLPCTRLVYSPTGPLDRDYDDLRRFAEAAGKGVKKAILAVSRHPLVMVQGTMPGKGMKECKLAGLLGALAAVYVPLMIEVGEKEGKQGGGVGVGWG